MQGVFMAALSTISYKYIIQRRKEPISYLVGYGIVIPLCIFLPYYQMTVLDLRNKIFKFCLSAVPPTLSIFRCTEAMYGFEPKHVSRSMAAYALYCGSPMELKLDAKTQLHVKSTLRDNLKHVQAFGTLMFITGLFKSLLFAFNVVPFTSEPPWESNAPEEWSSLERLFSLRQLKINAVHALLFQIYLTLFGQGIAAATSIGFQREPQIFMHNPVLQSRSPSEFWGKRWNALVHGVLKRGVFLPSRRFVSKPWAVLFVFFVSGAFHEWILSTTFFQQMHEREEADGVCNPPSCFIPPFGSQMAFFLWNAVIVATEALIGGWAVFAWLRQTLPSPIITLLVVSTALPIAHWFCDAYVKSNFFLDGLHGVPLILQVTN